MYQIAVCDDEQSDLHQSVQLTERILQEAEIPYDVTAYGSGVTLLSEIQRGRHFDLLLLDVIMDTLDGMALASHLKEQADPPDIVFISADRDMALLGYYVNAKRYLAKPLDGDELREALLHCYQEMRRRTGGSEQLLLPTEQGISASLSGTSGTPSPADGTPACTLQGARRSSGSPSPGWRSACRNRSSSTATELFWSIWPLFTGSGSGIWSSPAGKLFRSAVTASLRCVRRCWISLMPEGNGLTEPVKSAPCSIGSREP